MGAEIGVPVLREGRLTSILIVNHRSVRAWTPYEVELVEDMAERIWNVVERARAETALRQANDQLAETLRQSHPATRVLFITGYAESNVLNADMLGQDVHLLIKPFALKAFRDRVGGIVAAPCAGA